MEYPIHATTEKARIQPTLILSGYWWITFGNSPLNLMGPHFAREFRETITIIEADDSVKALVFDSTVEGFSQITATSSPTSRRSAVGGRFHNVTLSERWRDRLTSCATQGADSRTA